MSTGVYINMEMPTRCGRCDMRISAYDDGMFDHYECCITAAIIDNLGEKMEDCPLLPVSPHGRLIDAEAIRADIDEKRPGRSYEDAWALTVMDAAPTIIPAEEE